MGRVLVAYADYDQELATSRWRCFIPARALASAGHTVKMIHISQLHQYDVSGYDAVLAERVLKPRHVERIRRLNKDCKVIFTFDDAYTKMPAYAISLHYWRRNGGEAVKDFRKVLKMTDLNITPSVALNELYAAGSAPFQHVPNFMSDQRWARFDLESTRMSRLTGKTVIGWGGSAYHWESFASSGVVDALKVIQKEFWVEIRLFCSPRSKNMEPFDVRGVEYVNGYVEWADWPLEICTWDVSLAPAAGVYDLYRSNLRLVESGLAGVPYVASDYGPYAGNDIGGLIVKNTKDDWYSALRLAISGPDHIGAGGQDWARSFMMSENIGVYEDVLFG